MKRRFCTRTHLAAPAAATMLVLALAGEARAQAPTPAGAPPNAAAPANAVTPPVLVKNEGAEYPEQALRDGIRAATSVVLVLDVDATGHVTKATVPTPVGHGFDEAATAAAMRLEFEPARRGDTPIAARIKFNYEFPPPPAVLSGRVAGDQGGAVEGALVIVRSEDGKEFSTTSGPNGRWRLPNMAPGKYHVTVSASGRKPQEADEEIAPGEETMVTYRLAPEAPPPEPTAPTGPATPSSETPTEEVTVRSARPPREVTKRTIERREMERIPGTGGDAIRSLLNLPGVARPPGFAGLLIVRGSAPQDTQVFVDGTPIPIVYHFGGLSSVVPTEVLDKIDFYPGNFSAQYGRAMGGVVDVGIRDPRSDGRVHAVAQIDLIDARAVIEAPIGNTGWNFAVAGRRSYVDLWLKPVLEASNAGVTTAPVYYDYQAMISREFSKRESLRFMFFGSDDRIDILLKTVSASEPAIGGGISSHTGFWRFQGRYKNKFTDSTEFRLTGAVGQDYLNFSLGDLFFDLKTYPITARAEIAQKLASRLTLNLGMDMLYEPYSVTVRAPSFGRVGEPPQGAFSSRPFLETKDTDAIYQPALYAELESTPWKGGRIVPGVRLDYAKDIREWNVGPRVNVRQEIVSDFPKTTVKGGVGVYYQPPQPQQTNIVFGQPNLRANRAMHYALGVEQDVTRNVEVSLEGFYKKLDDLVIQDHGNSGEGQIYGLETLIRYKPDPHFFGWIAYTLSRSERRDTPSEPLRLTQFDQTHILTVLGSYRLGGGWELGARFRLVSGNRYTFNEPGFVELNTGSQLALTQVPPYGSRLPMFHQLDLRVDKTWYFKDNTKFGLYLDVQNVYNQGNVEGVSYNYNYSKSTYATGLPIIPSFGMRAEM